MRIEEVVGSRIAQARERRGMTQTELGKQLGKWLNTAWLPQAVWTAEKGKRAFPVADLVAFAHVLDVPVSYLLTPASPDVQEVQMPSKAMLPREALAEATLPSNPVGEVLHDMQQALADLVAAQEKARDNQDRVNECAGSLAAQLDQARELAEGR